MGYYVEILESTFTIPVDKLDEAYSRMCQLNFTVPNSKKSGGSWSSGDLSKDKAPEYGPYEAAWFSWMPWNYHEQYTSAEEILDALGFDIDYNDNGDLEITGYDSKTGQEELFLESICDISKGYIVWKGEDGSIWGETYGLTEVIVKSRGRDTFADLIEV